MDKRNYRELKHRGSAGKDIPKVYFCAHPDDYAFHFDEIYKALSAKNECSLWYDEDAAFDTDRNKRAFELEQMRLFVIPVTKKLLNSECRALTEEIPFARENDIPVLPIIVESGIEDEQFASVLGNMQYLVLDQKDPTAISFGAKLENYLSSVLVNSEISERIKSSFDGYVFLSYRKKDREHVAPIMRAIHQNEELRDVAVWYDEFLTPGEDFNENIELNLQKSNVFMLAVTPNLLETNNYVMAKEYPAAVSNQKPVVAIEVVKTGREALENSFKGIPAPIPIGSPDSISAHLKNKLDLPAIKKKRDKRSELEHLFLMGMAYFSGIDVETDRNRAFKLLEHAADEGLEEAMEQLSAFYRIRIGIKDKSTLERQQKYVLHCKERYESEGTEKSALRFADALEALGSIEDATIHLGPFDPTMLGHHPVPKACLLMISLLERTNEKFRTERTKKRLIAAYDSICEQYTITRRNGMIIDHQLKSIAILEDMAKYDTEPELYENISGRFNSLSGEVSVGAADSEYYLKKSMLFYRKAKGKDRSPETLLGYVDICDSLAMCLFNRTEKFDEGKRVAKTLLELLEEVAEKKPSREIKKRLCKYYLDYSDYIVDYPTGYRVFDPEDRIAFCGRAGELIEELYGDEDTVSKEHFMLGLKASELTAAAYDEMKNNELAANHYIEYIMQMENPPAYISKEVKNDRRKVLGYLSLSKVFTRMGFPGRAAKCALSAVAIGKLTLDEYSGFVADCVEKRDSDTLAAFVARGLEGYDALVAEKAESDAINAGNLRSYFANLCHSAYEVCEKSGQNEAAMGFLRSSIAACRRLEEAARVRQNTVCLCRMLAELGDLLLKMGNREASAECYLDCLTEGYVLENGDMQISELRLLANVCTRLAAFHEEDGNLEEAEKYYIVALKKRFEIYLQNNKKDEIKEGTAPLAALYRRQGNWLYSLKKTIALTKQMKHWQEE